MMVCLAYFIPAISLVSVAPLYVAEMLVQFFALINGPGDGFHLDHAKPCIHDSIGYTLLPGREDETDMEYGTLRGGSAER